MVLQLLTPSFVIFGLSECANQSQHAILKRSLKFVSLDLLKQVSFPFFFSYTIRNNLSSRLLQVIASSWCMLSDSRRFVFNLAFSVLIKKLEPDFPRVFITFDNKANFI